MDFKQSTENINNRYNRLSEIQSESILVKNQEESPNTTLFEEVNQEVPVEIKEETKKTKPWYNRLWDNIVKYKFWIIMVIALILICYLIYALYNSEETVVVNSDIKQRMSNIFKNRESNNTTSPHLTKLSSTEKTISTTSSNKLTENIPLSSTSSSDKITVENISPIVVDKTITSSSAPDTVELKQPVQMASIQITRQIQTVPQPVISKPTIPQPFNVQAANLQPATNKPVINLQRSINMQPNNMQPAINNSVNLTQPVVQVGMRPPFLPQNGQGHIPIVIPANIMG